MPIAAIASSVLGGLGSLYGQVQAGKEAKRGQRAYDTRMEDVLGQMRGDVSGQREDIARFLEPDVHRNYMQTAEAQSIMEGARGNLQDMARQVRGGVARTGGTTEAAVAGQEAATSGYADILGRLAGHGTQYRQQAQRTLTSALQGWRGAQHGVRQAETGVAGTQLQASQQRAGQWGQAGQNWLDALLGLSETFN